MSRRPAGTSGLKAALFLAGGASILGCAPVVAERAPRTQPAPPPAAAPGPVSRDEVIRRSRAAVRELLVTTEAETGLRAEFVPLPDDAPVVAQYFFDTGAGSARVMLHADWQDVDVAHEIMHMRLELVEGYHVLAWRRGVERAPEVEAAFARVRAYVDDEVVHARLARAGYAVDGEVLKPQIFDDVYANCARYLEEGRARPADGMAHLDGIERGDLCRAAFLVQAELVIERYRDALPAARLELARRFVRAFRANRAREAAEADRVLALFKRHDVMSVAGHREILREWSRLEGLDGYVGPSAYRREGSGYVLPWP